ncbi:MAG TPA: hypothetical protein VGB98_25775 [Pyrinomonadaceae bacterium]|jgi:hypothetical protein
MRALITFEDEARDAQPFWTCALPHALAVLRLLRAAASGALLTGSSVTAPLSVLDVQRSSSWPRVRVTRGRRINLGEARSADGFELTITRRGYRWTYRVGRESAYTQRTA